MRRIIGKTVSHYKNLKMLGECGIGMRFTKRKAGWAKPWSNYDKFLHFWKEAHPGIPKLIDAQKRLTALQTQ